MSFCPPGKLCLDSNTSYIGALSLLVIGYLVYSNLRYENDNKTNEINLIRRDITEKNNHINN